MEPGSISTGWKLPRVSKVAAAAGLTAFLALAGAGLAVAATVGGSAPASHLTTAGSGSSSSSTTTPPSNKPGRNRAGGPGRPIGGPGGTGLGHVVHGQYTAKSGSGYQTFDVQDGTVDTVTSTSITVTSTDKFVATYVVQPTTIVDSQAGGISAVAKGDEVRVTALVSGHTGTATSIVDISKISSSRHGFGFGATKRGDPPADQPSA